MRVRFFLVLVMVLFGGGLFQQSYAATGAIESGFHTTKVCHDATCTSPTPGVVNFRPTGATAVVVDDALGLSGDVWGNELGWITLNPTGAGVTFADVASGVLTGKAWSQVSGWINFAPTGQTVTINPSTGEFSGWAWTGGPYGGWIKFDCGDVSTCIKTDWRSTTIIPPSDDGGNPRSGSPSDICPNIAGNQATLPSGYSFNAAGDCIVVVDSCPNLMGVQQSIPLGFSLDTIGACVPAVDYCVNISGVQTYIPLGYTVSDAGRCTLIPSDACPNLVGVQPSGSVCGSEKDTCDNIVGLQQNIPTGYVEYGTACVPELLDMCRNIDGSQVQIPEGMMIESGGACVAAPIDRCGNLAGAQENVPNGFYEQAGYCFLRTTLPLEDAQEVEVVAFSFVPEMFQFPVKNDVLDTVVRSLRAHKTNTFSVDATSSLLVASGVLFILHLLVRVIRGLFR